MKNSYLEQIKKFVVTSFADNNVKIILFGSRARSDNSHTSDVDIGIIPQNNSKLDAQKIAYVKDKIDELNVPYKIEIVNFTEVSEDFKKEALKEHVVWKD